jgi:recombination protein RecA
MDISKVVSGLKKKYGYSSIELAGNRVDPSEFVSTGNKAFDLMSDGGVPFGHIAEFLGLSASGKSTFIYKLMANAQRDYNAICVLVDRENAYTNARARQLGIDPDNNFVICPPADCILASDGMGFLINFIEAIRKEDKDSYIVLAIDSVGAFASDTAIDKSQAPRTAKDLHTSFRKIIPLIDNRVMLVFSNHITYKVGVLYGCLSYKSNVNLSDGTTEWIGKIVNKKLPVEVLSYNKETKKIEPKKVINWYKNGVNEEGFFYRIFVKGGSSGKTSITGITSNHIIPTPLGEKTVKELNAGDEVYIKGKYKYSEDQHKIILGSILGDINLRFINDGNCGSLRVTHSIKQNEYCKWKAEVLGTTMKKTKEGNGWFETSLTEDLQQYKIGIKKKRGVYELDNYWIDKLTPEAIAIWYQDDGTFSGSYKKWGNGKCELCNKGLSKSTLDKIALKMERLGLGKPFVKEGKGFSFSGENSRLFQEGIKHLIHPSMRYKIKDRSCIFSFNVESRIDEPQLVKSKILKIERIKINHKDYTIKYDIEVEDNHNYFVGGVLVHNSNTSSTGGEAPKYYSHERFALEDRKKIIDTTKGKEVVGNWLGVEAIKTRLGACFRTCYVRHLYKTGIDYYSGYARLLADRGYLKPKNKEEFKSFKQKTLSFGEKTVNEDNIDTFLAENPELDFVAYPEYAEKPVGKLAEIEDTE